MLGTTLLFGKGKPYGETLEAIRNMRFHISGNEETDKGEADTAPQEGVAKSQAAETGKFNPAAEEAAAERTDAGKGES